MIKTLTELTAKLISHNSVSCNSNLAIINIIRDFLSDLGFNHEIIDYCEESGEKKYNLVSHRGKKSGGLVFLIHSDTVPLANDEQLNPVIKDNRLYGRGACDMKGPAAAALLAIKNSNNPGLPITVVVTSDEEVGCEGAEFVVKNSRLLSELKPDWGITTEPTELKPVYAHKGLGKITVTANGTAAHSSTGLGESANFKMIPFLTYIGELKEKYNIDESYQNSEFSPMTNTLNIVISDFNCALNVTPAKCRSTISFRAMPGARTKDVITEITKKAEELNLEVTHSLWDSLYVEPSSKIVVLAEDITERKAETVSYLTDSSTFSPLFNSIILGPGSIKQAHTESEYIDLEELLRGYEIYRELIDSYV